MNVLFWADGFWPRIGGAETYGFQFVEGMQKRGHRCLVLAQKDESDWLESEIYQSIPIKRVDFDALVQKKELKDIRRIKETLDQILLEFQPDIIYLNTLAQGSALAFLLFRKMFQIPIVARVHSPYWEAMPSLVKELCHYIDEFYCVSNWALNVMKKEMPTLGGKLKLIYNRLPHPELPPTVPSFSPPTVLLLGRLSFEKGFDTGIEAFALLKQAGSNAQLLIAGGGAERPFLEHLVEKLSLKNCTKFLGKLFPHETPFVINQATIVVIPSHFEAFGLVALEAMQMGRAVIASRVGGLKEIISDFETGLLIPSQDPVSLYKAMDSLLNQPEKTIQMGLQGRKRALELFDLERNLDIYEESLKQHCLPKELV